MVRHLGLSEAGAKTIAQAEGQIGAAGGVVRRSPLRSDLQIKI
jgi:hypothetical protein